MQGEYVVEKIVKKAKVGECSYNYLVKWKDFPLSQATWEPERNLTNVRHLIMEFENSTEWEKRMMLQSKRKKRAKYRLSDTDSSFSDSYGRERRKKKHVEENDNRENKKSRAKEDDEESDFEIEEEMRDQFSEPDEEDILREKNFIIHAKGRKNRKNHQDKKDCKEYVDLKDDENDNVDPVNKIKSNVDQYFKKLDKERQYRKQQSQKKYTYIKESKGDRRKNKKNQDEDDEKNPIYSFKRKSYLFESSTNDKEAHNPLLRDEKAVEDFVINNDILLVEIVDVKMENDGKLYFQCLFESKQTGLRFKPMFVLNTLLKKKCPRQLCDYYESKINFVNEKKG